MELIGKQDWFDLIEAMEAGRPQPAQVVRAVAILRGGMSDLHECLAQAEIAAAAWPTVETDTESTLGQIVLLQERVKGRRDRESKEIRQLLREKKARVLANYEKAETINVVVKDTVMDFMSLQALSREIMDQLDSADFQQAAGRMRRYWGIAEKATKVLSDNLGA